MTKKNWIFSITIGIVFGLIGGLLGIPHLLQAKPVSAASTADDVLNTTLNSSLKWNTVQGTAVIVWYGENDEKQEYLNTFAIQQPNLANISVKNADGSVAASEWISDGSKAYNIDPQAKTYAGGTLPAFSKDFSLLPTTLEAAKNTDAIYRHPFGMLIPSPVGEYLYPQWLAQGKGITYNLVGEDTILNRKVWIITYIKYNAEVTAWIDEETGIIVKYIQSMDGRPFEEMTFTQLEVNSPVDRTLFILPSGVISQ
jgi:outer membrane lipoprotein-sorting protein